MESKLHKFIILMMDIEEEELQYENYLKHQVQQIKTVTSAAFTK